MSQNLIEKFAARINRSTHYAVVVVGAVVTVLLLLGPAFPPPRNKSYQKEEDQVECEPDDENVDDQNISCSSDEDPREYVSEFGLH